jgi:hypothetical protein
MAYQHDPDPDTTPETCAEAEALINVASKDDLANCAKVLALALTLSQSGDDPGPRAGFTAPDLIEAHFPAAMETLATVLREVREEAASPTLH